jgi:uncharacterized Zn-binding protein involved in type VI secretion
MPLAARVGDFTSHAMTPLSPASPAGTPNGSPNVRIGGMPAWRATVDVHICPLSNGPQPHVGGPVLKGSLTVLINNFPAVRQGDVITEAGGPNGITSGCPTVQIGG